MQLLRPEQGDAVRIHSTENPEGRKEPPGQNRMTPGSPCTKLLPVTHGKALDPAPSH